MVIVNFSSQAKILFHLKYHFKCMRSDEHCDVAPRVVRGALGIRAWRSGRIWEDGVCRHSLGKIRGLTKRRKSEILRRHRGEPMRLAVDPIVLAPETMLVERTAPCEPCARCGLYYRLVRVGRLWMQPQHECRVSQEEAVN